MATIWSHVSMWALLLLPILPLCIAQEPYYYVKPTSDTPCPADPCRTLSEYVQQSNQYLTSNATMIFLPGVHKLDNDFVVTNVASFRLLGDPNKMAHIVCVTPSVLSFHELLQLEVINLTIEGCGNDHNSSCSVGAICAISVQQFEMHNCHLCDMTASALFVKESNVSITNTAFMNNSASVYGGGIRVVNSVLTIKFCYFVNNSADEYGGAIGTYKSNISLCRNNIFVMNQARIGGGAVEIYYESSLSLFGSNHFESNQASKGGAVWAYDSDMNIGGLDNVLFSDESDKVTFLNNSASVYGGGIRVENSVLTIKFCSFVNNSADGYGGAISAYQSDASLCKNNTFVMNQARMGGGAINIYCESSLSLIGSNHFESNQASEGGAVWAYDSDMNIGGLDNVLFSDESDKVTFLNNLASGTNNAYFSSGGGAIKAIYSFISFLGNVTYKTNSARLQGGALYILSSPVEFVGSIEFVNNSANGRGGAIRALDSDISIAGIVSLFNNSAPEGGGLSQDYYSMLTFEPGGLASFEGNTADRGAAIHVVETASLIECLHERPQSVLEMPCFFHLPQMEQTVFNFTDNKAQELGSILYGGLLDQCVVDGYNVDDSECDPKCVFKNVSTFSNNSLPTFSSEQLQVCFCRNNIHNCTNATHSVKVFRGQSFNVSIAAYNRNMTTSVRTKIRAQFPSNSGTNAQLGDYQSIQQLSDGTCTNLTYTVFSNDSAEELILYSDGPCGDMGISARSVIVTFLDCPDGFSLSQTKCICEKRLQKFTSVCNINDQTIQKNDTFWFCAIYNSNDTYEGLILYPHCPFDYCKPETVDITLNNTDAQCAHGHSGILCGSCHSGLSIALGSSHCLHCSNAYLTLILPFAVLGVLLVITILLLKLTVAIGTINGLIFYANIISANRNIFFPHDDTNVLTVFISWLNLDWGIETCFYDGMDTYAKTWLQFVFPFYIWALVVLIIIASHFSMKISKVLGSNPVAVLATLFLLSYAKILSTVVAALSIAGLEYPDKSKTPVWLYDGNIEYFDPKHIPLFLFSLLILLFLFLPYTLLLFFHQWLQMKSDNRILKWVTKPQVKAFMDAYHAPYTPNHRYWTGLLLILRCTLYLIFAFNTVRNPSVNLLVIATSTFGITIIVWLTGRVYENWWVDALESSFILNLGVLAVGTYHIKQTGGKQAALVYTLVSVAFTTFIGIILYHAYFQLKSTVTGRRLLKSPVLFFQRISTKRTRSNSTDKQSQENENDNSITSSYIELRELLLDDK